MDPAGEDVIMASSGADYDNYLSKQLWISANGTEVVLGTSELEARNTPQKLDRKPEKTGNLGVVSQRRDNNETVVPLEIIHLIIDHLRNDHKTLKTLINACPMLEEHCRPHLYSTASFDASRETDFSAVCPYPSMVRHLELTSSRHPEPTWMDSLLSRIDELSAVESLGCCDFHWEDFSDPGTACHTLLSSPVIRHIKDLFLCGFYADDFYDIVFIILAFPSLERLTISMDDVDEGSSNLESTHLPPPPAGLREVVVHEGGGCNQMGNFWSWFYGKQFVGLDTIELAPSYLGDYPLFGTYMSIAGDALTHLSVVLQSREHIFAFANTQILLHAKNLESLEVSQHYPDPWSTPILDGIFGGASCPRLAKLILPRNAVFQGYDPLAFEGIMLAYRILDPQRFPMLSSVVWK